MSLPTDCPQRDERRGWMGDAALTAEEAVLNFDMSAIYTNWLNIIQDDQNVDGSVTNTVPSLGDKGPGAPNWQTAYPTLLWTLLKYRDDIDVVQDHMASMKSYMKFFDSQYNKTGLKNFFTGFGDWVPPPPAKGANLHLVGAFSYLRDLMLFSDLARAVGEIALADSTEARLKDMKNEFNQAFYDSSTKVYGSGLQTEMAMGLWLNCPPPEEKNAVLQNLINDIMITHKIHPTTGIIGWKFMLEVLTMNGHSEVGIALNQQDTYPSMGYMIQGVGNHEPATTIWELWDSDSEGPGMNSRNHIMFGTVGSWFYKALLGIKADRSILGVGPDFSIVNTNNITSAYGQVLSPYGTVQVEWFVSSSSTCISSNEGEIAEVLCSDGNINSVTAYYGTPTGTCETGFVAGKCNSTNAYQAVWKACGGKKSCSFTVSNDFFGGDPCFDTQKHLSMKVTCSAGGANRSFNLKVVLPVGQSNTLVNIPIISNLNQTIQNIIIQEGSTVFWANSKYISGVPGIHSASPNPNNMGITVTVDSGLYQFSMKAQ